MSSDSQNSVPVRPNVIFVICDDLAWGDLACHGNPHTDTPHLDAMHARAARLTRYCSGPVCTPARAGIITGRWHLRTGAIDTYCGRATLAAGEPSVATCLREAGYRTGAFGKWHLGDNYPSRPMDHGFEETVVHLSGGIGQPGDLPENHYKEADSYFDPYVVRNGVVGPSSGYCSDVFTDACIDFIQSCVDAEGEAPFFAYLAFNAPHTPLQIGDEWAEPYRSAGIDETHARLYGMITNIDHNVGRLFERLRQLGLEDNTVVVFTSDHGPCHSARNQDAPEGEQHRFNAGLRGIKGSLYQGGIKVPSLWHWPGGFPAGDVDELAATVDVLPTLVELADARLPQQTAVDGVNLVPALGGQQHPDSERSIFMQWHRGDAPVRYRNYAVITRQWKLTRPTEDVSDELYDLGVDPTESTDLSDQHPSLVERLRLNYDEWFDDVCTTRGGRTFEPVEVALGTDQENPVLLSQNDWRMVGPDGWRTDDLRGYWTVRVEGKGQYDVTVRFRKGVPAGTVHLTLGEVEWSAHLEAGDTACVLGGLSLPHGTARLEAWLHTDEVLESARQGRFIPGLYVEIDHGP